MTTAKKKGKDPRGGARTKAGRKQNTVKKVVVNISVLPETAAFFTAFGNGYPSHGIDKAAEILQAQQRKGVPSA